MINRRPTINALEPALFGILEGKRKREKAEAFRIEEEARRASLNAKAEAQKQGYVENLGDIKLEETKQAGEKILYAALGLIVVAVMVALYFIKRK